MAKRMFFWYSSKQAQMRAESGYQCMWVVIDGKRTEYTECSDVQRSPSNFDDKKYLGSADIKDIVK